LVKFLSRGPGYNLFLTSSEAVLEFAKPSAAEPGKIFNAVPERTRYLAKTRDTAVLRMKFVGTSETVRIVGLDESPSKSNYLLGNDPKRWRKNVPTFGKVRYRDIYPGIDLVFYGNQQHLEYDFVVSQEADPRRIFFDIEGADHLSAEKGDLVVQEGRISI